MTEQTSCIIVALLVIGISVCEVIFPDQKFVRIRWWWPRVLILQALVLFVVTIGVQSWQNELQKLRLMDGARYFSSFWGGVASYLIGSFLFYWWHRARHEIPLFWRLFHQMHHSPSRIQAVTAFYVHPLEAVASSLINATLVFVFFGLGPEALIWNATFMAFAGVFYHMNLSTPRVVGYFVQRPEMHRYHHQQGVHALNYSDLPIWDLIFGTYYNPKKYHGTYGFGDDRELQFAPILLFQDISGQPANSPKPEGKIAPNM